MVINYYPLCVHALVCGNWPDAKTEEMTWYNDRRLYGLHNCTNILVTFIFSIISSFLAELPRAQRSTKERKFGSHNTGGPSVIWACDGVI